MSPRAPVIGPGPLAAEPLLLVSYPKSGNTWIRILLSNYLADQASALDLNDLRYVRHIASQEVFEYLVGLDAVDLSREEIARLRVLAHAALRSVDGLFPAFKVHDAFHQRDGTPCFPLDGGRVVYIARNPLDVCVSVDRHFDINDLDASIAIMAGRARAPSAGSSRRGQVPQYYGAWTDHVLGWTQQQGMKRLILRYEDLVADPEGSFIQLLGFLDLEVQPERLKRALEAGRFDRLQSAEAARGFRERLSHTSPFFRSGKVGGWRQLFTPRQVDQMIADQARAMRSLGYLAPNGDVRC